MISVTEARLDKYHTTVNYSVYLSLNIIKNGHESFLLPK
nr:MAG TPA: hypothetical protein [Bacteriophage sp.]